MSEIELDKVSSRVHNIHEHLRTVKSLMTEIMRDITWIELTLDRHVAKVEESVSSSRQPTGLAVPINISGELCEFMHVPLCSKVSRVDVTRAVHSYIKTNELQDQTNKKVILPDAVLGNILQTTDPVPYLMLQRYLKHHFLKNAEQKSDDMPVSDITVDDLPHMCYNTRVKNKYDGYCVDCYVNKFPDNPISRNYNTKRTAVADFVKETFALTRDDLIIDMGDKAIVVKIHENQHSEEQDCICENTRMTRLSQDLGHKPIVLIRFNPDEYITNETQIASSWCINRGICELKTSKKKQNEWTHRLDTLADQIRYWSYSDVENEAINLFYDTKAT
jgi:hypothetical protein